MSPVDLDEPTALEVRLSQAPPRRVATGAVSVRVLTTSAFYVGLQIMIAAWPEQLSAAQGLASSSTTEPPPGQPTARSLLEAGYRNLLWCRTRTRAHDLVLRACAGSDRPDLGQHAHIVAGQLGCASMIWPEMTGHQRILTPR